MTTVRVGRAWCFVPTWDTLTNASELLHPTVFRQGYVEAKHRSATWWETKEGVKVRAGAPVEEVLHEGVGSCPETSLRLVVRKLFLILLRRV